MKKAFGDINRWLDHIPNQNYAWPRETFMKIKDFIVLSWLDWTCHERSVGGVNLELMMAQISIIKDVLTWRDLVSKLCISSNWQVNIVQNVSRSGSRILDPVLKGVELLIQKESGSASFGAIFEWSGSEFYELSCWILLVKPSGSNILHDIRNTSCRGRRS